MTSDDLAQRVAAVEDQLERLRGLVVRAYEDTPGAAREVLRARRDPAYEDAYAAEPLVTVRIGAYRGGEVLFDRALASVRRQTHANWEAIVVCDGRDEETAARVAALAEPRIRCLQRPRNGPYPERAADRWKVAGVHPFNQAVAFARGAWIAPLDQDDEWVDDHLEALLAAAAASRAEVVYGVGRVLLGGGGETYFGTWPPALADFGFQTAIYHAGLAALLYDVNSHLAGEPADWNLARRMLEAGVAFEFLERVVTTYFVDADDATVEWWRDRERERGAFAPREG
jgi:glycosyltransferase involved in cell wall biosynthesis